MVGPGEAPRLPSLLGVTIRRSFVVGRLSLIIGCAMVMFYSAAFGVAGTLFVTVGALILPIFAVTGGVGGALVFANDRMKGVLEYLVAYGISPRQILWNTLIAGLVQVSLVVLLGVSAGTATYLASGHALTLALPEALLAYTLPMSYLTVTLMTVLGVFWTSLASPRSGMNSPLGVLPLIGVVPPTVVLVLVEALRAYAVPVLLGSELVLALLVLGLLFRTDRLMPPVRLLSSA